MNKTHPLHNRLQKELNQQKEESLFRSLTLTERAEGNTIIINGKKLINFCSNDYLNLSSNRACKKALLRSIKATKTGSGSSRLISGNSKALVEAETALAQFFQYESALLFPSGYQANLSLLSTLFQSEDVLFFDKQLHASMIKGMTLSSVQKKGFNHNDFNHLQKRIDTLAPQSVNGIRAVAVESCYSMKGDSPPFNQLKALVSQNGLFTIVDEAHALAVCGPHGRGLCAEAHFKPNILIGTLGKAFGVMGAFILCSQTVKEYLINFASPLIYTTAFPPFLAHYVQALLPQIEKMDSKREALCELSKWTKTQLKQNGIEVEGDHHILALPIGKEDEAIGLARGLQTKGFYTAAIRFPTVAKEQAMLRLGLTASHTRKEVSSLIKAIVDFKNNRYN